MKVQIYPRKRMTRSFTNTLITILTNPLLILLLPVGGAAVYAQPVTIVSPSNYTVAYLKEGDEFLIDRDYTITRIPSNLEGCLWIKTANEDKNNSSTSFLTFNLHESATAYVAYDRRGTTVPNWLSSQFTQTSHKIEVSDQEVQHYNVWSKEFDAGTISLGGNMAAGAAGANTNYFVLIKVTQSAAAPDLIISTVSVKANYIQKGDSFWFKAKIKNVGDAPSGRCNIDAQINIDGDSDLDIELDTKSVAPLNPGEETEERWTISSFGYSGEFFEIDLYVDS